MLTYKVIELSTVTEDAIEETLNQWSATRLEVRWSAVCHA